VVKSDPPPPLIKLSAPSTRPPRKVDAATIERRLRAGMKPLKVARVLCVPFGEVWEIAERIGQ
jgi:hypothetical protein